MRMYVYIHIYLPYAIDVTMHTRIHKIENMLGSLHRCGEHVSSCTMIYITIMTIHTTHVPSCIHIYTCIHIFICIFAHMYIYMCLHIVIYTHVYIYSYVYLHICIYIIYSDNDSHHDGNGCYHLNVIILPTKISHSHTDTDTDTFLVLDTDTDINTATHTQTH